MDPQIFLICAIAAGVYVGGFEVVTGVRIVERSVISGAKNAAHRIRKVLKRNNGEACPNATSSPESTK